MAGLAVPGVGGDRGIGAVYNSLQTATGSVGPTGLLGPGFRLTESPDVRLVKYPDGSVRFIDASGRAAVKTWRRLLASEVNVQSPAVLARVRQVPPSPTGEV